MSTERATDKCGLLLGLGAASLSSADEVAMTPTSNRVSDAPVSDIGALTRPSPVRQSLTRAACLALLAPGGHGRVAATLKAVPIIIPVSFTLIDEDVVFSLGFAKVLSRAVADSVVAFETDQVGSDRRTAWEVHVTGVAKMLTDDATGPGFRLPSEIMTGWSVGSEPGVRPGTPR